jgi:hypothetical protein
MIPALVLPGAVRPFLQPADDARMRYALEHEPRIRSPLRRAMAWFVTWMVFGFSLVQSVSITVEWWPEELKDAGAWEWCWIASLPVLLFIFLRFFPSFNPGRRACPPLDARARATLPS